MKVDLALISWTQPNSMGPILEILDFVSWKREADSLRFRVRCIAPMVKNTATAF